MRKLSAEDMRGVCCFCQQQGLAVREATKGELDEYAKFRGFSSVEEQVKCGDFYTADRFRLVGHDAYGLRCKDGEGSVPEAVYPA